ncbi:MAG: triose-phosphate isomerase [Stappiaceae bacterium]
MSSGIKPIVAGNWKMNGILQSSDQFEAMCDGAGNLGEHVDLMICPPATLIGLFSKMANGKSVGVGAQDCHTAELGAHTGDLSALMLKDAGAGAVIVGHSERRADHGEDDALVNEKARAAWSANLPAIICVGETETERKSGQELEVVGKQLSASIPDGATPDNTIIAYEPVWAIGTGMTPTAADVETMHTFIRKEMTDRFGAHGAGFRLLYGGSVKPANAAELMAVPNVNGALVGGASLKASDFLGIAGVYA